MNAAGLQGTAGRSRSSNRLAGRQTMPATATALQAPDEALEAPPAPDPALHGAPGSGSGAEAPPPLASPAARCAIALLIGAASRTLPTSAANAFAASGPTNPGVVQT